MDCSLWDKLAHYIHDNDVSILAALGLPFILLFLIASNAITWGSSTSTESLTHIQSLASLVWLIPLPVALLSLLGIWLYRGASHLRDLPIPDMHGSTIYFRLVTRGINQETVTTTAISTVQEMEELIENRKVNIPYIVEIVTEPTDTPIETLLATFPHGRNVQVITVPKDYLTTQGALFKARALHYAIEQSTAQANDWVFHLDDESRVDRETLLGILEFVSNEEDKIKNDKTHLPHIGQGTILYHRDIQKSMLYTLADSLRTADDLGRYFLQYMFHTCVFGMHGSYILCRNSIEQSYGFDFRPEHCITEDAYWGLRMMQQGYKFGHVNGFLHEQSPAHALDFIKQRRRWFRGILHVLHAPDILFRYKAILITMSFLWAMSGVIILYTALNVIHPVPIPPTIGLLASFAFAVYILMYMIGFYVNSKYAQIALWRKIVYFFAQLFFIPVFALLEAFGAVYGLLDRKLDFHVIKK